MHTLLISLFILAAPVNRHRAPNQGTLTLHTRVVKPTKVDVHVLPDGGVENAPADAQVSTAQTDAGTVITVNF